MTVWNVHDVFVPESAGAFIAANHAAALDPNHCDRGCLVFHLIPQVDL